jgi:hypothetical protein
MAVIFEGDDAAPAAVVAPAAVFTPDEDPDPLLPEDKLPEDDETVHADFQPPFEPPAESMLPKEPELAVQASPVFAGLAAAVAAGGPSPFADGEVQPEKRRAGRPPKTKV